MAVDLYEVRVVCETCAGTGELPLGEAGAGVPCQACGGDGVLNFGTTEGAQEIADLTDKVDDCLNKLDDILEKLNE